MTGQRVTRELLSTLRPGDVVVLRSTDPGRSLRIRATLSAAVFMDGVEHPDQLVLGDGATGPALTGSGYAPLTWARDLELTVLSRVPRLYENSTRTEPVAGDIVRDKHGCAFRFHSDGMWQRAEAYAEPQSTPEVRVFAPLQLLWDGATGSLPGASS